MNKLGPGLYQSSDGKISMDKPEFLSGPMAGRVRTREDVESLDQVWEPVGRRLAELKAMERPPHRFTRFNAAAGLAWWMASFVLLLPLLVVVWCVSVLLEFFFSPPRSD